MAFKLIAELFSGLQTKDIKRKYPTIIVYNRYLTKISTDEAAQSQEVKCFTSWLLQNPDIATETLTSKSYTGSSTPIVDFTHIFAHGTPETIEWFWNRMKKLEELIFPNGRPEVKDEPMPSGAAAALAVLENNPLFAGMIENIKSTVADLNPDDMGSIMQAPAFQKFAKDIRYGIQSGKYQIGDLMDTIKSVIESIQNDVDPETKSILTSASSMMTAAEKGEQPDINALIGLMKNLK